MTKKLSPAQQTLLTAITGKTLTYRIVSWRSNGTTTTRSLDNVKIGGRKAEIKVRLSTLEALAATGDVILTCVDHDNKEYTVTSTYDVDLEIQVAALWETVLNGTDDEAFIAYMDLAKLSEVLEQYPDAIDIYTAAIKHTGKNEDYLYGLHRAYRAMGDSVQAEKYLKQARTLVDEREIAMGRCNYLRRQLM